jgi:hypothetical protein
MQLAGVEFRHHARGPSEIVPTSSQTSGEKTAGGDVSMADLYPSIAQCAVVATAFKVLLFPA